MESKIGEAMSVPYGSDPWLDARLRNVPLPAGMLARLNHLANQPADESLGESTPDASNGPKLYRPNQPVPLGPGLTDEQMDAALFDVPLPAGLRQRLERISLEPRRRIGGRQLALAASVFVAIGVAYVVRSALFLPAPNHELPGEVPLIADVNNGGGSAPVNQLAEEDSPITDMPAFDESDIGPSIDELRWQLMKEANRQIFLPDPFMPPANPAIRPSKETVFASDRVSDTLPELDQVIADDLPRGIAPPLIPGFDLRFLAKHHQHPFVIPAAHKDLESLRVPLVTSSASYQEAWQAISRGKLADASDVRVEEFLAAVNYNLLPAAPGSLALRTAAGPSPFANAGMRLLQVAVQAGQLAPQDRSGTSLTVVVDTSSSMRRDGRLAMVRRALADMAAQLIGADRLSLVATSGNAEVLLEAASPQELPRVMSAIQSLEPEQVTNIGAGLEAAYLAACERQLPAGEARRVMLVTDGLADLNDDAIGRVETLAKDAAGKGVLLQIMRLGGAGIERDSQALERIATAGGGRVRSVADANDARSALSETLSGRNQSVAREAALRITFNPQVVAAYRLLGHETVALTGATAAPPAIDMRSGEAATALVELRLNPQGGDEVATVELTWQDAVSGEQRSAKQRVSRLQFAKTFAESPLSLQAATIVAHTAEVLRNSYFTGTGKSLRPVLDLAAQASPLVTERPEMRIFLSFVEQAEKVRARGGKRP